MKGKKGRGGEGRGREGKTFLGIFSNTKNKHLEVRFLKLCAMSDWR